MSGSHHVTFPRILIHYDGVCVSAAASAKHAASCPTKPKLVLGELFGVSSAGSDLEEQPCGYQTSLPLPLLLQHAGKQCGDV